MSNLLSLSFVLLYISNGQAISNYSFPNNFMFGVASSAYQIEGGYNSDDKSESIWDYSIHRNKSIIEDQTNGDIADSSIDHYEEDLKAIQQMGLSHYKFSLSWSRILPKGYYVDDAEGRAGVIYYQYLIEKLLKMNVTPIVTLYHWDLPQSIQKYGGWVNESNINLFVEYARYAFKFCFKAKYFITFDEPKKICKSGYGDGTLAPFIKHSGTDDYICAANILKAHAAVYKMFHSEFNEVISGGKLSISLDGSWSEPNSNKQEDVDAARRRTEFEFGLYANPIFVGNWPAVVQERVKFRSEHDNKHVSRLPTLNETEIKGTADFLAVDFFDIRLVADDKEASFGKPGYEKDMRIQETVDRTWIQDTNDYYVVPGSLRKFLNFLKKNYSNPEILITANGVADDNGTTHDYHRITFLAEQLSEVVDAINEDKVNVIGYTYWSLLDSFEWIKGIKPHFGLYGVNLSFENGTRIDKSSAHYYGLVAQRKRVVDPNEQPTTEAPATEVSTKITHATRRSTTNRNPTNTPNPDERNSGYSHTVHSYILMVILAVFVFC